uniref:cGMP-dependent protein kinase n=2 Tax=Chrysotila carterae TaxID=13221 RepID=A0A7S4BZW7_CHRCT
MYNCPRTATIMARTDVVLWSLDRVSFRSIVLEANTKKASMYESFLEKVQLLEPLTKDQRNRMVDALEEVAYKVDEKIIQEGEAGTHFYIIVEGEVVITKGGQSAVLARRSRGDYFGELSLKTGAPTIASVVAADACKVIRMDRGAFQRLLGPLDSLLALRKYTASGVEVTHDEAGGEGDGADAPSISEVPANFTFQKATGPLILQDFNVTKDTLGEGAFGKVRRCIHKKTGQIYALKQMVKADIVSMGQVEHIMQETQILSRVIHPFITNKFGAIVTQTNLILIMEFCPGGDMFDQLYKHKAFSLSDARIFIMQVLLPLEYLHSMSIVHRDLKLENLLLAQDGALKLTDFGFAKLIKYRSWTLCGTPEYLAPEIILEKGHGKAVDYWALGVLFYEMLNGHSPFEAEETLQTYQKILDGTVNYPPNIDPDAKDLIGKLLQKDISRRLGNLRDGALDIKNHPFYKEIDWESPYHYRGSIRPSPFDAHKYNWVHAETIVTETKMMREEDQSLFKDFTA